MWDLPPELRTKVYDFAIVCCDVVSITRISHKNGCTNKKQLAILHHQNCGLAKRDTQPIAGLLHTCKKIRHETSFKLYNSNAFGLCDVPTLILWLEIIGPANRAALRSLEIEGDGFDDLLPIISLLDPEGDLDRYDSNPSIGRASPGDPYRKETARVGDLLSESLVLEALHLPCGYKFWQLPPLTLRQRDADNAPWQTNMARRIAETLVEDFALFFRKRLLLDNDTEKLSKVIKVDVVRQKDGDMPASPAIKGVLTQIEEGAEYLNLLLKYIQHKQNGGKPWPFCLAE
ncbi:hypothetical protein SGCOL_011922 [Colletotrichum sp. CLE4]